MALGLVAAATSTGEGATADASGDLVRGGEGVAGTGEEVEAAAGAAAGEEEDDEKGVGAAATLASSAGAGSRTDDNEEDPAVVPAPASESPRGMALLQFARAASAGLAGVQSRAPKD